MTLHADATVVLESWGGDDDAQNALRLLFLAHLGAEPEAMTRTCLPDHLTASCLVMSPDGERVVLTHHAKAGLWLQTGGHCEPQDTTLAGSALREATEETGIHALSIDPTPLRLSRHEVPFCGPVTYPTPKHHLDVQFMAVADANAVPVRSEESSDLAWWPTDSPPEPTDDDVRALIAAAKRRLQGTPSPSLPADND